MTNHKLVKWRAVLFSDSKIFLCNLILIIMIDYLILAIIFYHIVCNRIFVNRYSKDFDFIFIFVYIIFVKVWKQYRILDLIKKNILKL